MVGPRRAARRSRIHFWDRPSPRGRLSLRALAMTTLDMTGRLGSTLHGFELDKAYAGDTDEQGRRHGYGTYRFPNAFFTYRGDFVRGAKHGRGRLEMADGGWYEGDFAEDEMTGTGERRWADGRTYEGGFEMGEMHGQGTYVLASGDVYRGAMVDKERHGTGKCTYADGSEYEGGWLHGAWHVLSCLAMWRCLYDDLEQM